MKGLVYLYDKDKNKINELGIDKLKVLPSVLINRCKIEFGESDPCVIQKRNASLKILFEMKNLIETNYGDIVGKCINISDLPNEVKGVISFDKNVDYIMFI